MQLNGCSDRQKRSAATKPHIFQHPALSKDLIAFGYAGDLWTVPRAGGVATRLTTGVGIETDPVFSPDGSTIAFTGDYDGNTDVFTIPATGGVPFRVTYHPAADFAVAWTPDGKNIVFRSTRISQSRYTQLVRSAGEGRDCQGCCRCRWRTRDSSRRTAKQIAYSPLPPAYGFDYMSYVSWGNYHGGRASTIWITTLPGLESVEIPHEASSDFVAGVCGREDLLPFGAQGQGDDLQVRSGFEER